MNGNTQNETNVPNTSQDFAKEHASVLLGKTMNITSSFVSRKSVAVY